MRADHYRIVGHEGQLLRRPYKRLRDARHMAYVGRVTRIAAMDGAGKVLRYLPVNPKANP